MKTIATRLEALEQRTRDTITAGDYCTHAPAPIVILHGDTEKTPPNTCHICGKEYPPGVSRPVIVFEPYGEDTAGDE